MPRLPLKQQECSFLRLSISHTLDLASRRAQDLTLSANARRWAEHKMEIAHSILVKLSTIEHRLNEHESIEVKP